MAVRNFTEAEREKLKAKQKGIMLYKDKIDKIDFLPPEQFKAVIVAIFKSGIDYESRTFEDPVLNYVYETIVSGMDIWDRKFLDKSKKNSENGSLGAEAKKANATDFKQLQANVSECQRMPENASDFKQLQANVSECQRMPENASDFKQEIDKEIDKEILKRDQEKITDDRYDISPNLQLGQEETCPEVDQSSITVRVAWNRLEPYGVNNITSIDATSKRKELLEQCISKNGLDVILEAIEQIKQSNYLCGKTGHPPIQFDWFLDQQNFIAVLEGKYNNRPHPNNPKPTNFSNFDERSGDLEKYVWDNMKDILEGS